MNGKKWFEVINFYSLCAMGCIWVSSWLFMMPHKVEVDMPLFDNMWGMFFTFFGAAGKKTADAQQIPDLLSGVVALFVICVMQLRGILKITSVSSSLVSEEKRYSLLITVLNLLSILVHTLFFAIIIKVFVFPNLGTSYVSMYERMKLNIGVTVFCVFCIAGIILGVQSVSKLLFIILVFASVFRNISIISSLMGVTGYIALVFAVSGFYLEFCADGINRNAFLIDMDILSGRYSVLLEESAEESGKLGGIKK